jgi:pimeloyl-ACP methyl ester carboxylesterase
MEFERPAVMFVHGLPLVRDPLKNWVTYCRSAVIEARAAPVCFGYSRWTGWVALLRPGGKAAARLAREFLLAYEHLRAVHGIPVVVAHSLGSYLVAQALAEHPDTVAFRGAILLGSIVRPDYDWASVIRRGQVPARFVRNEVGLHDWALRWVGLLRRAGYPYGPAGLDGFEHRAGRLRINYPYVGAAGARGLARYCRDVWIPFLKLAPAQSFARRPAAGATPARVSVNETAVRHSRSRRDGKRAYSRGPARSARAGAPSCSMALGRPRIEVGRP